MTAIDPSELTVSELREEIKDLDDPEELRAIRDAEADGEDRKSAKEAIERRITQCENENEAASDDGGEGDTTAGEEDDTDGESVTEELGEQLADFEDVEAEDGAVESTEARKEGPATGSADDGTTATMSEAETPQNDSTAESESTGETDTSSEDDASLIDVRDTVLSTAADLIGRRLDGISGIQRTDEGWSAIVNVIERRSVPDTQDILGRYEITLDSSGEITGYHRLNRYRRGDTTQEDWQ